jgi:phage replication initiation protein
LNSLNSQKTTIDWLRFRAHSGPTEALEALKPMFGGAGAFMRLEPLERGILGFQEGVTLNMGDMKLGRMDFGGESQRGWIRVDLTGKGCEWVQDWDAMEELEKLPASELRRLDVALTTWDGEITHEQVVQAHTDGRFTIRRPPALRQIISSDPRAGRTCEIGKREQSDKFMRCYEKGFELAAKSAARMPGITTHIDGKRVEDIYRCEVEFKATGTDIPWEVVERRDQYFAGAYPFCADILPNVEADILMRRPERAPQTELAAALENCRIQFGPTLFTALMAYQGDMTAIWDKIIGAHHNQALLEAGVLLVDHE